MVLSSGSLLRLSVGTDENVVVQGIFSLLSSVQKFKSNCEISFL